MSNEVTQRLLLMSDHDNPFYSLAFFCDYLNAPSIHKVEAPGTREPYLSHGEEHAGCCTSFTSSSENNKHKSVECVRVIEVHHELGVGAG